jgi:trigger factor
MVNAKIENITETKKKISIHVPREQVGQYLQKAYQKVSGKAKIKGFRPGKIPNSMLDRYYGPEIDMECLNFLVDETYPQAIYSNNIIPISKPDFSVTPIIRNEDYHYSIEIEVKPVFELKDYKGIPLKETTAQAAADEIQKELTAIQENLAELVPTAEGAKLQSGMVALIDFEGKIDGTPFEGGTAQDYMLHYGKGHFLKDFEEQMAGLKAGDEKVLHVTFPADYFKKEVAEKKADFLVKVKALHDKKLPALDDELAKDVGKKDLAELKSEIERLIVDGKKSEIRRGYADQVRAYLLKTYDFEIPEGLIKDEVERTGRDRKEITDQIRCEFILEAIAVTEKIEPKPEDIDRRLAVYAQIYRQPIAQIKKTFLTNKMLPHLMSGILIDKALDLVIDQAKMA